MMILTLNVLFGVCKLSNGRLYKSFFLIAFMIMLVFLPWFLSSLIRSTENFMKLKLPDWSFLFLSAANSVTRGQMCCPWKQGMMILALHVLLGICKLSNCQLCESFFLIAFIIMLAFLLWLLCGLEYPWLWRVISPSFLLKKIYELCS